MRQWPVQDAKARFSELLDASLENGPQVVSRRGKPEAVLVSLEEWESLKRRAKPDLKELLLGPGPRFDLDLPPRGQWKMRDVPDFE